jgi:EAL domain-containing protein (putative c-di-GMP-specific phosphodiesterase class I)
VAQWLSDVKKRGIEPVPISVNVSRVDFYFADIAEHFINLVKKYELNPSMIGIEITESALTDNMNTILEAIKRMREYGFHVLMDDFGSGSSSLSMLHTMDVDVLKTDMQFLAGNDDHDERGMNLVRTIVTMAKNLGMTVVSEGVETEWQKDMLVDMNANYAQGYYFYRPMPVEEFEKLIADRSNVEYGAKSIKNKLGLGK